MLFYFELPYFLKDKLFFYVFFRFLNGKTLSLDSDRALFKGNFLFFNCFIWDPQMVMVGLKKCAF